HPDSLKLLKLELRDESFLKKMNPILSDPSSFSMFLRNSPQKNLDYYFETVKNTPYSLLPIFLKDNHLEQLFSELDTKDRKLFLTRILAKHDWEREDGFNVIIAVNSLDDANSTTFLNSFFMNKAYKSIEHFIRIQQLFNTTLNEFKIPQQDIDTFKKNTGMNEAEIKLFIASHHEETLLRIRTSAFNNAPVPVLINSVADFKSCLESLPPSLTTVLITKMKSKLPKLITSASELKDALDCLPVAEAKVLFQDMKAQIPNLVKNNNGLVILLTVSKKIGPDEVFSTLSPLFPNLIKSADDLTKILSILGYSNQSRDTINLLKNQLPSIIKTPDELKMVRSVYHSEQLFEFLRDELEHLIDEKTFSTENLHGGINHIKFEQVSKIVNTLELFRSNFKFVNWTDSAKRAEYSSLFEKLVLQNNDTIVLAKFLSGWDVRSSEEFIPYLLPIIQKNAEKIFPNKSKWSEFKNCVLERLDEDDLKRELPIIVKDEDIKTGADINKYIAARSLNFNKFFCFLSSLFGGIDRDTKLSAAEKLRSAIELKAERFDVTPKEYDALIQGRLGKVAQEHIMKAVVNDIPQSTSKYKEDLSLLRNTKAKSEVGQDYIKADDANSQETSVVPK
ncbi:MAG: hypothetical protein PSV35_00805, partial [bacterium]|nr:hypothetical protein [bacterium]